MSFTLSWKTHIKIYLIAVMIAAVLFNQINNMAEICIQNIQCSFHLNHIFIAYLFYITAIMIPITLLHELIHGAAYMLFKGKIKIGFKGIYAYCHETSGIELTREKFLFVLLMPVTVISLLCMILPLRTGLQIYLLNLLGSSGDLYMAFWLCRLKSDSRIIDKIYGFDVKAY